MGKPWASGSGLLLEDRLKREALSGPIGVILCNVAGDVSWCNDSAAVILREDPQAIVGSPLVQILKTPTNSAVDSGFPLKFQRRDGTFFHAHQTVVRRPTGNAHYLFSSADIANAWQQLRHAEASWRHALEASGHGAWDFHENIDGGLGPNGPVYHYSDNWKRMRGVPLDEAFNITYQQWLSGIHPDDLEHVKSWVERQDAGEADEISYEYRERRRDGQYIWILARGRVIEKSSCGTPIHIVGVDVDITSIKAEQQVRIKEAEALYHRHLSELEQTRSEAETSRQIAIENAARESVWHSALDNVGHGVWSFEYSDSEQGIQSRRLYCSHRWHEMRGLSVEDLARQNQESWRQRVHPDDLPAILEAIRRTHVGETEVSAFQYRERHADGHWIWILCRGKVVNRHPNGKAQSIIGIDVDITHEKLEEEKRTQLAKLEFEKHVVELENANIVAVKAQKSAEANAFRESIWRQAVGASGYGVWCYVIDHSGPEPVTSVSFCSDAWFTLRGAATGQHDLHDYDVWIQRIHPDDLELVKTSVARQLTETDREVSFEYRERHAAGHWIWILVRGTSTDCDELGRPTRITGIDIDITKVKEEEARKAQEAERTYAKHLEQLHEANHIAEEARREAQQLARQDMATGLANRRYFREQVGRLTSTAQPFTVFIVDLDHFKEVNDLHGHAAGDHVLKHSANRLADAVGDEGFAARLGGDEFGVVLHHSNNDRESHTNCVAARVIDYLRQPITLGDLALHVGASIGAASYPDDGQQYDLLLQHADMALYRAKAELRGQLSVYTSQMGRDAEEKTVLESDLRAAIAGELIEPWFQPIISANGEYVVKLEVLARWNHHTRGMISPEKFVAMAEHIGMLPQLTASLLRRSCEFASNWPNMKLSLNITSREACDPATPLRILDVITRCGRAPSDIEIEITEQAMITDPTAAKHVVAALRSAGIRVFIDDFGEGYAGIGYLRDLAVDGIKFDRSCVADVCEKPQAATFLQSLQVMAAMLGFETVAEGIESPEVWAKVRSIGCNLGQGYHFAKPMPADAVSRYLAISEAEPGKVLAFSRP